ncbi:hypothetical protein [Streptomyces albidoflavus]|uniref:hypothetical protein n=1 Tax=Streptomyces albidoflavus TaxID=1886 RepID=UPI001F5D7FBA|nr:hypothetical protein [Streptomyces albidoflavus]
MVCLFSGVDGALLTLLDSATVTAWRTGLAAALGTHLPASPGPSSGATVGVIGAGAQADLMVRGLRALRPCGPLLVHDLDPEHAAAFTTRHDGRVVTSPQAVAAKAGIVPLATWSRTPLLHLADTRPGQHLTTLGADEPGKRDAPDRVIDLLSPGGLLVLDDFTPSPDWPPRFKGAVDHLRLHYLTHPSLDATEVLTTPDSSAVVATRRDRGQGPAALSS